MNPFANLVMIKANLDFVEDVEKALIVQEFKHLVLSIM